MSAPLAIVVGVSPAGIAGIGTLEKADMHVDSGAWVTFSPRVRDPERASALCRWINKRAAMRAKPRCCHACGQVIP